ncbi:MAG: hypothetical protein ABIG71_02515 [Candidatus Uhrbacteria bacterium]
MASARTIRNLTILATCIALIIGSSIIFWDTIRPLDIPDRAGQVLTTRHPVNIKVIESLSEDARFRKFVQLTPEFTPSKTGSSNPFLVLE